MSRDTDDWSFFSLPSTTIHPDHRLTIPAVATILFRRSLPTMQRDATSPVYLDSNSIAVASIPSSARRVAQCVSSRLRSSGSDVASIASSPDAGNSPRNSGDSPPEGTGTGAAGKRGGKEDKKRAAKGGVQRNKWTAEETAALVRGCNEVSARLVRSACRLAR